MKLFNRKAPPEEPKERRAIVRVNVGPTGTKEYEVNAKVFDRQREMNVLDVTFYTQKTELYAFYAGQDMAREYAREHGYAIDHEHTNVEVPTIKTLTNKRSR